MGPYRVGMSPGALVGAWERQKLDWDFPSPGWTGWGRQLEQLC